MTGKLLLKVHGLMSIAWAVAYPRAWQRGTSSPRFRRFLICPRASQRALIVGASFAGYVAIFAFGYPQAGAAIAALALLPVAAGAWLFGPYIGVGLSLLAWLMNTALLNLMGEAGWDVILTSGGGPGMVALMVVTALVGTLSRLHDTMRRQAEALEQAHQTALRLREIELARSQLDVALLVARTVAHEINNALSPVTGYTELLALRPAVAQDSQAAAYLASIHAGADEVALKVGQLQRIVRLEQADCGAHGSPVLDLNRSTAREE